jgi:hypothetical protein
VLPGGTAGSIFGNAKTEAGAGVLLPGLFWKDGRPDEGYPFDIPAVRELDRLKFASPQS